MAEAPKIYDEIVDFFAKGATTADLIAFRPSEKTQERVRDLLDRNKTGELSPEDAQELERFGTMEHFVQLVKARAHLYVDKQL
jgi:hypothetical protein